jgi:hypothetical protein
LNYSTPGTPRTREGKADLSATAPTASDGKPDLSGIWRVEPTPLAEMKRTFGGLLDAAATLSVPGMEPEFVNKYFVSVLADARPNAAPLRKEAIEKMQSRASGRDPMRVCMPAGPLAPYVPEVHKIIQMPEEIVILYEADNSHRQIYTDGRSLPKEILQPSWQGYSAAKWEDDTLVVETAGFNDKTWLDIVGHPHGEALHITERYHRRDFGHMDVAMTFEDPQYYTKPFTIHYSEVLVPDTDVLEFVCNENEKDNQHARP